MTDPTHLLLQIVRGIPDGADPSVEVAALVAVLAVRRTPPAGQAAEPDAWSAPARALREPVFASHEGWVDSGRPR